MTDELAITIEELYTTFAVYPFNPIMEGCPCCVSQGDKEQLHIKKLRDLEQDNLSKYAFKAMSTWGNLNDFKHYLPRIFELLSSDNFIIDGFIVLEKLEYGHCRAWPANEQIALENFLLALWSDSTQNKYLVDEGDLAEFYRLLGNMDELLRRWPISFDNYSFSNFVQFVFSNYNDLCGKRTKFKSFDDSAIEKIMRWINDNTQLLETGFFHFEESDKAFSNQISIALFIIEQNNKQKL